MSEKKKILFIGGGFTKQISNIVGDFTIPTIGKFVSSNQGLLKSQARELGDFISGCVNLDEMKSWEIDIVKQIKDEIKDPEKKQKLLNYAQWIYSDTLGLNYGISPTCPDKRREAVSKIIEMIEQFMSQEDHKFQAIMTTNHDLTLDHWLLTGLDNYNDLLKENSQLFGFQIHESHWIKTPDQFSEDYFSYKAYKKATKKNNNFRFLKLHGALNWWRNGDGFPFLMERLPQWASGKSIRQYYFGVQEYLMGPDKKKDYERQPYKKILEEASKLLSEADEIVFYGFGFGEADKALAEKLFPTEENNKKIEIIDINSYYNVEGDGFSQHQEGVKKWFKNTGFNGKVKIGYPQVALIDKDKIINVYGEQETCWTDFFKNEKGKILFNGKFKELRELSISQEKKEDLLTILQESQPLGYTIAKKEIQIENAHC